MSLLTPERLTSPQPKCNQPISGGGIMSYHCSLPQGHTLLPADDPEPCWAVESDRSARLWDAWKRRQMTKEAEAAPQTITCPSCHERAMEITPQGGVCGACGTTADLQPDQPTTVHDFDDDEADFEAALDLPAEHTLTDPACQMRPADSAGGVEGARCMACRPLTEDEMDYIIGEPSSEAQESLRTREGDQRLPDGDESQPDDQSLLIADIEARRVLGIQRYGQGHRPFNGRDTLKDWYEEQLDGLVYARSIVRMAEATREDLVTAVSNGLIETWMERTKEQTSATPAEHCLALAEVAVDRIMGYVAAEIVEANPPVTNPTVGTPAEFTHRLYPPHTQFGAHPCKEAKKDGWDADCTNVEHWWEGGDDA